MRDVGLVAKERIGTAVGPYRLLRLIGSGAMGVVFEAEHEEIGQHAAVKLLLGATAQQSRYIRRFLREARAACAVRHPGLVQVFDCGVLDDQTPYLLMEYVDGESLRMHLATRGKLTVDEATSVTRQIASTLVTLHARAIVHRDIKPENVLLVKDDAIPGRMRAKLIDFGIARFGTEEGDDRVTEEGAVVGTPHYMAPEQCMPDGALGSGTDIYALGVLLFEMLTGELPFTGDMASVMRRHVLEAPSLDRLDGTPTAVRQLVEAMLAKDPARRPAAVEMLGQLGRTSTHPVAFLTTELRGTPPPLALPASQTTARGVRLPRPRTLVTLAACGLALALVCWKVSHPRRAALVMTGMVHLTGGTFTMGSTAPERALECTKLGTRCVAQTMDREQPSHEVRVSPFFLDVNETTNAEFLEWIHSARTSVGFDTESHEQRYVSDETGTVLFVDTAPTWGYGGLRLVGNKEVVVAPGYEDRPVVQVTWEAARRFCAFRGKRLPTEAEHDFAASGANRRRFPWGDDEPRCDGTIFARQTDFECAAEPPGAQSVGSGKQDWTPEGVHGLGGNVAEWVEDAFSQTVYGDCGACVDPVQQAASATGIEMRVVRGGSWASTVNLVRSAGRAGWDRKSLASSIGLRCALAATP